MISYHFLLLGVITAWKYQGHLIVAQNCPPIESQLTTGTQIQIDNETIEIPNEVQIGEFGHFLGIRPKFYNLTFIFKNVDDFQGRIIIGLEILAENDTANRIFLHANTDALNLNKNKIILYKRFKSNEKICINKLIEVKDQQIIILDLAQPLLQNESYNLEFGEFFGTSYVKDWSAYPDEKGNGSIGLQGHRLGVTSIFWMRYARTMFPCFDHPSLKAVFNLCIGHTANTTVFSNTRLEKQILMTDQNSRFDCFEPTSVIPIHTLSINLVYNYKNHTSINYTPEIEIHYPK